MPLGLIDLLRVSGFDPELPTGMVRHKDPNYPLEEMRRNDWLELYQSYQKKPVFHKFDQIVSFYGVAGTRAAFYGVYRKLGRRSASEGQISPSCPWSSEWSRDTVHFYDLERDVRFDEFRDRLIIDWPNPVVWKQEIQNRTVLEILPPGRRLPPFSDYLEFTVSFAQLESLFEHEEAHRDWRVPLSSVAGIYLILAQDSGHLYVGSAYGAGGIWGRWRAYAQSGHGGNVKLKDLISVNVAYPEHFRFSVLQILPKTMTPNEIFQREGLYKLKLGTRATGLNSN